MQLNPIVKKDVKVQSRSMKICWGVFIYELILAFVFFLAILVIRQDNYYTTDNIYSSMVQLYPTLAVTQLVILGIVVPVRTAASISGERERQTFDIMMTTGMTPFSVVMGKVATAIIQSMLFVVASMPVMALPFIIGGMSWGYLFCFLGLALLISFFSASIGILCSSICRKSISAVIMSYGFYLIFFIGTFLPYYLYMIVEEYRYFNNSSYAQPRRMGENLILFMLLNPILYLVEFFIRVMTGDSMVESLFDSGISSDLLKFVMDKDRWMICSTILFVAVSFFFLWMAAMRIDPMRRHVKRKKRQIER